MPCFGWGSFGWLSCDRYLSQICLVIILSSSSSSATTLLVDLLRDYLSDRFQTSHEYLLLRVEDTRNVSRNSMHHVTRYCDLIGRNC